MSAVNVRMPIWIKNPTFSDPNRDELWISTVVEAKVRYLFSVMFLYVLFGFFFSNLIKIIIIFVLKSMEKIEIFGKMEFCWFSYFVTRFVLFFS
jgi:hypothetical protein